MGNLNGKELDASYFLHILAFCDWEERSILALNRYDTIFSLYNTFDLISISIHAKEAEKQVQRRFTLEIFYWYTCSSEPCLYSVFPTSWGNLETVRIPNRYCIDY